MRFLMLLLAVIVVSGCQTAEFAIDHQITGLRVAAKFEARDRANPWNGGDSAGMLRR
jgi:hypothetical protein